MGGNRPIAIILASTKGTFAFFQNWAMIVGDS
jgi:hypothetical protein